MADSPAPAVYRVADVAALLCIGRRQTYEAIARGEIPCHKIGSQVRCSKVAVHAWLDGRGQTKGGAIDLGLTAESLETHGTPRG